MFGASAPAIYVDAASVLVKPSAARAQIEAENRESGVSTKPDADSGTAKSSGAANHDVGAGGEPTKPSAPRRFFGTVEINPDRAGRDMGRVAGEILQHLTTLPGGKVTVTVDIQAETADGVTENLRRVIDENCRTLGFKSHGFEES